MDMLLEYLYHDVMKRYWINSTDQERALEELETARGKSWNEICDAAHLLAERQSFSVFLAAFHLGFSLENTLCQKLGQSF